MFKLMTPKHEDWASIRDDILSYKLLVCRTKKWICVCLLLIRQKSLIDFCCDLPNDGKQKQVKATELYLLWIFC